MEKHIIYLDHAATTPVKPEVLRAMEPYFTECYGNPSSVYEFASPARGAVEESRRILAETLQAEPEEIYFTGGGSESDNWAIKSVALANQAKGKHIITSTIEHHAVLHTCQFLEKQGFSVTYVPVDAEGILDLKALQDAIRPDTILISVMYANNEIGTIQPIRQISQIAHEHGILFHTDAVQAYGHIPVSVREDGIDLLSASGHKLNGPKGVGFLYVRKGVRLLPFLHGGAQERGKRAGTHNVPGIVGLGAAARLAADTLQERMEQETALRDHLISRILTEIPHVRLNGHSSKRLPNNVNVSIQFLEGESMLMLLDMRGICASSGSACTSGSLDPSHVLLAIGLPHEIAHGSLRMTLSEMTTREELDFVVDELKGIVERLRGMSPLYEDFLRQNQSV